MSQTAPTERWSWRHASALAAVILLGTLTRLAMLPAAGLKGDLDQFVLWVHAIAANGLGNLYDQNVTFPAVMAYIWGVLAFVDPVFRTVIDSSDEAIRAIMKIPASLADIGLALLLVYAFRGRPFWAVVAAAIVMLHPATIDVSAWWGQYESIYLLSGLAAVVLALNGRNWFAAAALAVCLMTKPQALPFILPFAAWFWSHGGWREVVRAAAIGLAVIVVLWLPFIPAGGPINYLRNLAVYQNDIFPYLSLNAWNVWWILEIAAVGGFASDAIRVLGPLTFRDVGFLITGLLTLVVAVLIVRDPKPRTFIMGLTASTLIWFTFLTQMHERYAYAALIFPLLLIPDRRIQWFYVAFSVVFTLNLWSATPPAPIFRDWLPYPGLHSLVGAAVMIGLTGLILIRMRSEPDQEDAAPDHRVAVDGGPASV